MPNNNFNQYIHWNFFWVKDKQVINEIIVVKLYCYMIYGLSQSIATWYLQILIIFYFTSFKHEI